jgi:hypothetical protein
MISDQGRAAYSAEPFQAFVMHLADGRNIAVQSREFMANAPGGRTVAVYQPDGAFHVIDLLVVTDLGFKPTSNGKGRRKSSHG